MWDKKPNSGSNSNLISYSTHTESQDTARLNWTFFSNHSQFITEEAKITALERNLLLKNDEQAFAAFITWYGACRIQTWTRYGRVEKGRDQVQLPEWSAAQAVDEEERETSERSLLWQRNGTCKSYLLGGALGAFRGVWLDFTKNDRQSSLGQS